MDRDKHHQVRLLDPLTGQVRTVLGGTGNHSGTGRLEGTTPTPDISAHCWKLPDSPPPGALEHEERWRLRFADLEHFWHSNETGAITPLATGMHDAHATLHGSWPDRTLQVTIRHPRYPDGVIRRTIQLYDELGRPADLEYADVLLMEDLDTNYIPPVEEARNGILDM
ncbi:MAG: hypothetical protein L0H96_13030 [Humibacillus sp.]|nr:hypothetical protein [Humibacillus sp.]MDN5777825.1 hypothetical protein [Humibacillus sp.]